MSEEYAEQPDVLYDYLYIDRVRLESLYTQLFSGLLAETEKLSSKGGSKSISAQVGGDPFGSLSKTSGKETQQTLSSRLSPHDLILDDVLNKLRELDFICSDPLQARPGNILLLQGKAAIVDFSIFQGFIKLLPLLTPDAGGKNKAAQQARKIQEKALNFVERIAAMVPWSLTVLMQTESITTWGGVRKEDLRADPGHLALKYGPMLAGRWHMLALVDATPGLEEDAGIQGLPEMFSGLMTATEGIRDMAGRPVFCVGVTPLLIFRELTRGQA